MRGEVSPAARRARRDRAQIAVATQAVARASSGASAALIDIKVAEAIGGDLYEASPPLRDRLDALDLRITELEPDPVALGTLALSSSAATQSSATTINITGASAGSTITVQSGSLPAGMSLDSGARTISGTPTTVATSSFTLREALTGATGSPKDTALSITVAAGASNIVQNGGFSGATNWTLADSADVAPGNALRVGAADTSVVGNVATQAATITAGKYYEVTYTITQALSGGWEVGFAGGTTRTGTTRTTAATFVERILANTGNNTIAIRVTSAGTAGQIDNLSIVGPYNTATVGGA